MSLLRVQEIEVEQLIIAGKAGVPIGHPYLQLPGMPEPSEIYTGTWENVSDQYPGDFFRVEGGKAAAFDASNLTEQDDQMQGHKVQITNNNYSFQNGTVGSYNGGGGNNAYPTWASPFDSRLVDDGTNGTPRTGKETRSINRTIRIWKRIS